MATATLGKESQSTEGEKEMTENEKFIRKITRAVFLVYPTEWRHNSPLVCTDMY